MEKVILTIDPKLLPDPALDALFKKLGIKHEIKVETKGATGPLGAFIGSIKSGMMQLGLFAQGVSTVTSVIQGIGNAIIKPASEIEQLKLRLTSLYGSTQAASTAFSKFRDVASRTPATLQQVVEAGASLKAFGMDAEATLESVSDLAAYMGMDVVEASQAVGRAFAGGAGAADILRERGVLELIKSFKGIDDLTKLTLPEFRTALLESLSDPAAGIAGSADRMSKSYAGAVSNMQDSLQTLSAKIGSNLTPIVSKAASVIGDLANSLSGTKTGLDATKASIIEQQVEFETLINTYTRLHQKQNRSKIENDLYKSTIETLLTKYPNYLGKLDLEKGNWQDIAAGIATARTNMQRYINVKIQEAILEDQNSRIIDLARQKMEQQMQLDRLLAEFDAGTKSRTRRAPRIQQRNSLEIGRPGETVEVTSQAGYDEINILNRLQRLNQQETALKAEFQRMLDIAQDIYTVDITPPRNTGGGGGGGGGNTGGGGGTGGGPLTQNVVTDAESAHQELVKFLATEEELIEMEYKRLLNLAKSAYSKTSPEYATAIKKIEAWKTNKLFENAQRLINQAEQSEIRLRQLENDQKQRILDGYNNEIARLADLKTIGALTYDELTGNLRNYTEQIKVAFGEDSREYRNALASLQSAQLRISETLATQWKSDNAAFLDAWNATTGSLVAGFETAWASIFDVSLTGSQRIASVWDAMKSNFLSTIGSMASEYIKSKLTQLAIELTVEKSKQGAILATLGVQKSALIASVATGIKGAFSGLFEAIGNVWKWWTQLIPPPFSILAATAAGAGMITLFNQYKGKLGFASGGLISGPGTGTSDSVPILASNGEYVINARSVSTPGILPVLNYINSLNPAAASAGSLPAHYASGGLVTPSAFPGISELISEVRSLRADLYKAQPTIINHAPNPISVHKLAETGRKLYKGY